MRRLRSPSRATRLCGVGVLACLGVLALTMPPMSIAQDCTAEIEPNDTPELAVAIGAPGCLTGALDTEDDLADHLLWTLGAGQAGQRWGVTVTSLDGRPATLTMSRVTSDLAATPMVTDQPLVELPTGVAADVPVASDDLLLRPGRYVLAVTPGAPWAGSPTAYRIELAPGAPMPPSGDHEPNEDATQASLVRDAFDVSGDAAATDDFYGWVLSEAASLGSWTLEVHAAAGAPLALSLLDEVGAVVGQAWPEADSIARLPDLRLGPGRHTIRLVGLPGDASPYVLRAYREELSSADPEPNDDAARALPIVPAQLVAGRLARQGDVDAYRLSVDAALAEVLLDARLIVPSGPQRLLCLWRLEAGAVDGAEERDELTCAHATEAANLSGLLLGAGDYLLTVSGEASRLDPYYLRVDQAGAPLAGFEIEPNDTPELATPMTPASGMRGRLDNWDYFRLQVDGEPQLWEVEARGPAVRLGWMRTDGATQARGVDPDGRRERSVVTDVYLIPGDHWFAVDGSGEYTLEVRPLGPPVPGGEREPNDDLALANELRMGDSVTGRLGTAADVDAFRFSLAAPEHVRLTLDPPPGAPLSLWPQGDTAAIVSSRASRMGEPVDLDLVLPAGDHAFSLSGPPSTERYRLSLRRLDPFALAVDQEPNDQPSTARPMPTSLRVQGTAEEGDPADWYRLEDLPASGDLTFRTEGAVHGLVIDDGWVQTQLSVEADGATYRSLPLPAGASVAVGVKADGPYAIAVDPGSTGLPAREDQVGDLPVELTLTSAVSEVAAFEDPGQRVEGSLSLTNTGSESMDLELDAAMSQPGWTIDFESTDVSLGPGSSVDVPLAIVVPTQAWADTPVRATVRARAGADAGAGAGVDARQSTAFTEITPRSDVDLVGAIRWWSLPDELLGGLDVSATARGAVPIVSVDALAEASLHDAVVPLGAGMDIATTLPTTLTIDLAGDEPVPVAGTILDPTAATGAVAGTARDFDLLLSEDGVTYTVVFSGELSGALTEQAFVLPEPVLARFAQLRVNSRFPGSDRLRLGEWKVVATPGWQPRGAAIDIVDPALGGHVVWFDPQPGGPEMLETMLSDPGGLPDLLGFDPTDTKEVTWVVGFQNGRAARVTEFHWSDPPGSDATLRLDRLELASSIGGPLGPWEPLGTWDLERDAAGAVSSFRLPSPAWSRHIRLSGSIPRPARKVGVLELPGALNIWEQLPAADYRSVSGEWGYGTSVGPLEWQQPLEPELSAVATDADRGGPSDSDVPLGAGQVVSGRVARGVDSDWYTVAVPDGQQAVRFRVSGRPTVGVALALFDEAGVEVPMAVTVGEHPGSVDYEGAVTPGSRYRLRVEQPPHSLVVAYDTSGSIGPFIERMAAALRSYVAGLAGGEEAIQLVDFESPPLLEEFSHDRYLILNALDAHAGSQSGSSSAEIGLIDAAELLAGRVGTRAILVMTDADSPDFDQQAELWRWLALVRPRVFSVHVSGASAPLRHRWLMQDWAAAGDGYYQHVRSSAAIAEAFDRMAAWLRRPADYRFSMALSAQSQAPEPGSLQVVSDPQRPAAPAPATAAGDEAGPSSNVAVELVLDTSGSMLQKMGRKRRIDVAKDVLARLVAERLAPGTPVALRAFRQQPKSCESELVAPLGPLDRVALATTIDALGVRRTVKTPLAAAIRAVATDLAGVTGPRVVVILTDGQESCGGDPEAAIQALAAQGFDVTVNVVGLGLDKAARRQIARLAELGAGAYYDAGDAIELAAALTGALGSPYVVLDAAGNEVGSSTVDGPPVELPPGAYRVALVGSTGSLGVVEIESGEQRTVVARV